MRFRFSLTLVWLCLLTGVSWGQVAPQIPKKPIAVVHSTPELNEIRLLFRQGMYHHIIERATIALDKAGKPAAEFLYWRGYARRQISLLDEARADLEPLGDITGWATLPSAKALAAEVDALIALRPPHQHDIRDGDKVVFRVYYEEESSFLTNVIDSLPKGYKAASTFTGEQTEGVPVFVFGEWRYERFVQLMTAYSKKPPRLWWRILSHAGAIFVSQRNQIGESFKADYAYLPVLFSHEMTHLLTRSVLGNPRDFPNWFSEGMARCAEAVYLPSFIAQNDRTIQQLLAKNAILPLDQLASSNALQTAVDNQKGGTQNSDAYAQSYNMTRYLQSLLNGKKMPYFIVLMRDKEGFSGALKQETGMTIDEFYQSWLKAIDSPDNHFEQ
ncbi:hypothetical protein EON83_16705 [bacterium]|nr:MAG: hypothetical protein EON83_16705 [bacterium]